MDLYGYINSQDIREHLISLNYQFDSMEASWLVYQSGKHTLEEKINAWNWIIENMPDCEVCAQPRAINLTGGNPV